MLKDRLTETKINKKTKDDRKVQYSLTLQSCYHGELQWRLHGQPMQRNHSYHGLRRPLSLLNTDI